MKIQQSHKQLVERLVKPGEDILNAMSPDQAHQLHMVLGLSGESGEVLDAMKKHVIYDKPLDVDNVIEELGDIEFYLEGLRQSLGLDREMILQKNIEKLSRRYPQGGYTDQAAQERLDKVGKLTALSADGEEPFRRTAAAFTPHPYGVSGKGVHNLLKPYRTIFKDLAVEITLKHNKIEIGIWRNPKGRAEWFAVDRKVFDQLDQEDKLERIEYYVKKALGVADEEIEQDGGDDGDD